MNIFVLDQDVDVAAKWHVDRHVVKMPLETAQMQRMGEEEPCQLQMVM